MKHHKKGRTLSRKKGGREALLRSLARSLVLHGGIETTVARAKELRPFIEKLVSASKADTLASRRVLSSRLHSPEAVKKLHDTFAPRYKSRAGGYTRITRLGVSGNRNVEKARIEFLA